MGGWQLRCCNNAVLVYAAAALRPGFAKLVDRMEAGDVLVVTKLDRLGRNAMDVRATVEGLAGMGVRVHCLALGGIDLTSPASKMTMAVIAAVAEFERDLLIERTQSGLARARAEGKTVGRPSALTDAQQDAVRAKLTAGASVASLAREYDTQPPDLSCGRGMPLRRPSRAFPGRFSALPSDHPPAFRIGMAAKLARVLPVMLGGNTPT